MKLTIGVYKPEYEIDRCEKTDRRYYSLVDNTSEI